MPREVPARVLGFVRALGVHLGKDVEAAMSGLSLSKVEPTAIDERVDWDELAIFIDRIFDGCSVAEIEKAGEDYVHINMWYALALPFFATPRLFYSAVLQMTSRLAFFPHMNIIGEPHETHLHVEFHLPDNFRACAPFFHGNTGQYRQMTKFFGQAQARVESNVTDRHGIYDIYFPEPPTKMDRVVESGRNLFDGLAGEFRRLLSSAVRSADSDAIYSLQRAHGLTLAESRVAYSLSTGRSVAEVAADLRISVGTVRSHLKSAYAKTGARGQSELVRIAMSTSPLDRSR